MKYGITQWSFPGNGLYAIRFASEAGYDGLQLELGYNRNGYYLKDPYMQSVYKEEARKYNIEFMSVVDMELMEIGIMGERDGAELHQAVRAIHDTVDTAKAMGCKKIMLPFFMKSQLKPHDREGFDRVVQVLTDACDYAAEYGITVQMEVSVNAEETIALYHAVDRKNLRNYYDSQNLAWYYGLEPTEELPQLLPYCGDEIHVCDGWGVATTGTNGCALLGTGTSHFDEQIQLLAERDWDGWLIVENCYYKEVLRNIGNPYELSEKDLKILKSTVAKYYGE